MDPKLLADALTEVLAPALPALAAGGKKLIEEAGQGLGEKGGELVRSLWGRLRGRVEERPAAAEAARDVARAPEDPDARGALRLQLRKILEADPDLARELAAVLGRQQAAVQGPGAVAQGTGNVAAGAGGIAAGRDVKIGGRGPGRGSG